MIYSKSLTEQIAQAFSKLIQGNSDQPIGEVQNKAVQQLSEDLADGIEQFITEQTFEITEMICDTELESLKSTGTLSGDVLPQVTSTDIPFPGGVGGAPITIPLNGGLGGVKIPKLNLDIDGGQGGNLVAKGNASINASSDTQRNSSKVELITVKQGSK
tara:strand:+ start:175 stop:651 length:477 start_codon:yes stop_codon:yes gene_type:complete